MKWNYQSDNFAFVERSETMKAPVGLLSDRMVLRQQDGGALPRQVRVCERSAAMKAPLGGNYSAFSGSCSAGFMVLTRRVKYSKWQTHTTAMHTLPIGAFFMQRKPMAITAVTIAMILHFVPAVMAFF